MLGVVYTMDHEVVPRPCKICDWLLNSSWDHFDLDQGKKTYIIHWIGPTGFGMGEAKKVLW
jgi:hypothetical protein